MSRWSLLSLLVCTPFGVLAAPVPPEDEVAKLQRAYGTWSDPDKDSRYTLKEGELRISLPAENRHLGVIRQGATNNAPRVLREVEGNFTAVVRVACPTPKRVPKGFWPSCSGGLLAWESHQKYMVIQYCSGNVNGNTEAIWSNHISEAENLMTVQGFGEPTKTAFVRLKREGDKVTPGWSLDGKKWKDFKEAKVNWGAKVKVGLVAENCLEVPVEITFDQYSLTLPKP
jgi:regulation of enolase protein 1 (concanavalin A-like superfamily)